MTNITKKQSLIRPSSVPKRYFILLAFVTPAYFMWTESCVTGETAPTYFPSQAKGWSIEPITVDHSKLRSIGIHINGKFGQRVHKKAHATAIHFYAGFCHVTVASNIESYSYMI